MKTERRIAFICCPKRIEHIHGPLKINLTNEEHTYFPTNALPLCILEPQAANQAHVSRKLLLTDR